MISPEWQSVLRAILRLADTLEEAMPQWRTQEEQMAVTRALWLLDERRHLFNSSHRISNPEWRPWHDDPNWVPQSRTG